MKRFIIPLCLLLFLLACQTDSNDVTTKSSFRVLEANQTQINFENQLISTPELNILNYLYYYNGAGVCIADFNNDNLPDVFFVSNQEQNELYLNHGELAFENFTEASQIPKTHWSTGATAVDVNQDGLMDLYICQVTGLNGVQTQNQLLVNQGLNTDSIPVFKDEAAKYGLNISSYAQQAGFFDYDKDGDLDMFLLNHSLYPNRTYGNGEKRKTYHPKAGDKLFENKNGFYVEVTKETNIFSSDIGYGLDFSLGDINLDGFPDLFVGNDFFENDYLYINQSGKSFKDIINSKNNPLGHTTHFSMGNAMADMNNDLLPDILSVDMLPEHIEEYKVSGTEYPYLTYRQYLKNKYSPQYMSNALHINQGNLQFSETAETNNVAATDWSWSALMADFNNDLYTDIFISNGILGATNDMDFIKFISNKTYQEKINRGLTKADMKLLDKLPKYKKQNKLYLNSELQHLRDSTVTIQNQKPTYSNGATYADLDLDGDLDLIVNNSNDKAQIYENLSQSNFLKIKFNGNSPNKNGIGSKVMAFIDGHTLIREHFINQGYMSSSHDGIHFGLGKHQKVDSLWVVWPSNAFQTLTNVSANQVLEVRQSEAINYFDYTLFQTKSNFDSVPSVNIPFQHFEYQTYEFSRKPLIPFSNGNFGPHISVEDVNADGLDDVFISNAKLKSSQLYIQQQNHSFKTVQENVFSKHKTAEDVDQLFVDIDNDGDKDLIVVSAGNEFEVGKNLQPRLYENENGQFKFMDVAFPIVEEQFNTITTADVNADGYMDVFIGAGIAFNTFGKSPKSYLFINQKDNTFKDETEAYFSTHELGMIRDAEFVDITNDGINELVLAGHFMPIEIYSFENNSFRKLSISAIENSNGLWNTIYVLDINNDGLKDLFFGNFGTNTKLKASTKQPIRLRINDFNQNQSLESILTYFKGGKEVLFNTKDELSAQIPQLNKKFRTYKAFAEAEIQAVFDEETLTQAEVKEVFTLESLFLLNEGDFKFKQIPLPKEVHYSSINTAIHDDFNNNTKTDLLLMGNRFDLNTQLGQLDANKGLMLEYHQGNFEILKQYHLNINQRINSADFIEVNQEKWLILGVNNDSLKIFRRAKK